jgi:hypothetical protein
LDSPSAPATLEVKGAAFPFATRGPHLGDYDTSGRYDFTTGAFAVNSFYTWKSDQNKTQVAAAVTHYADIAGSTTSNSAQFEGQLINKQAYFNNILTTTTTGRTMPSAQALRGGRALNGCGFAGPTGR